MRLDTGLISIPCAIISHDQQLHALLGQRRCQQQTGAKFSAVSRTKFDKIRQTPRISGAIMYPYLKMACLEEETLGLETIIF